MIGVVIVRTMDTYRVDIGASAAATISYLSFEGATKKNRPDVKVGCIIAHHSTLSLSFASK